MSSNEMFVSTKTACDFKQIVSTKWHVAWGCSDFDGIFLAMREADPIGDKVFINAGFNKGEGAGGK
jgi:hypothetical protein